jgi:hypothetical protein
MEPNNKVILYKVNLCSMRWRLGLPHVHSRRLSRTVLLMPSDFELEDLSNKGRVASTPPDASVGRGLRPPTYLGEPKDSESTTAYWAWATSVMFVALQLKYFKGDHSSDPWSQSIGMVVCPHFFPSNPATYYWRISSLDATRVLLGITFWTSIGIFGRGPRCQCDSRYYALSQTN